MHSIDEAAIPDVSRLGLSEISRTASQNKQSAPIGLAKSDVVPGASIHSDNLKVIAFKTRSPLRYLRFMAAVWFRRHTYSSTIELVDCVTVECHDLEPSAEPLFVEADGELLGTLPVRIEVVPQALTLLILPKLISRASHL